MSTDSTGGAPPGPAELAVDERPLLLSRLRAGPLVALELRPPRTDLSPADSMDAWIDMHHAVRRLAKEERFLFVTDNAVGTEEEENLAHLAANLEGDAPRRVVPFLTCKHTLEYCLVYAQRAAAAGFEAITVVGGDQSVGAPRCLPHARLLRARIRERVPSLVLGGWANPHKDPVQQAELLRAPDAQADYFLTQVVSHHSADRVEALVRELERQGVQAPGVFGVFFYRSAHPPTLARLGAFFPVPAASLAGEFEAGATAEEICARSIRALKDAGADKVYVSNLGLTRPEARLARILERV